MNRPAEAGAARVLMVGPPNAGKSTLFNALTGAGADTGNYSGTTVSVHRARTSWGGRDVEVLDLPGAASLVALAADEEVTLRALLDLATDPNGGAVLLVLDGPRLARSLYLALQVLALELPVVIAVNLLDEALAAGRPPDVDALSAELGVPVVATSARTGEGLDALRAAVEDVLRTGHTSSLEIPVPEALDADLQAIAAELPDWAGNGARALALAAWSLQSLEAATAAGRPVPDAIIQARIAAAEAEGRDPDAEIATARYAWIDARMPAFAGRGDGGVDAPSRTTEALDAILLHPLAGTLVFGAVLWVVFTALFSWADPAIGFIEDRFGDLGDLVSTGFDAAGAGGAGALGTGLAFARDLTVEGIIGGVGSVLVFLPQIALLFLLLALLEDCGYLARAAALMDRVLRTAGLPGKAFVPLLSGYACAVPAIMATRTMPRWRDRLLTMLVVPLTSCSARLPVYTLLVAALFPATATLAGFEVAMQPLALLSMYAFSTVLTVVAAVVVGRTAMPAPVEATVLELPPYRLPIARNVVRTVVRRCTDFVQEAGRVILVATIVLWGLLTFPKVEPEVAVPPDLWAEAVASGDEDAMDELAQTYALRSSVAGRMGRWMEPVIAPLGMDWKMGVGLVGSFAAREVFVSTMGVVYGVGEADEEDVSLRDALRDDRHADGTRVWTPRTGLSVMVFFAVAMQCLSTLAVLRKETNGWRWPIVITVTYTALAWVLSFVTYQGLGLFGWA